MGNNVVEFSIKARDQFTKQFDKLRNNLNKIALASAATTAAFAGIATIAGRSLIEVGDKTESLRLRMNAMLGSVEEGNRLFDDMATFASKVPFEYEQIMVSATQLSGVMKGGVDEVNEWMPMIADLAAVSGLSIEKTTEQITRMYSAGAGAADLFRERGITAMLGFQAGVSVSAEDTRAQLIRAFEDPQSKFRGAAGQMATTWTGLMSMMSDKWFAMRDQLNKAGVFNYFKAIAIAINDRMGQALNDTKANAESWANVIIDGIRSVMMAVGFLADMFRGLQVVWQGMNTLFAGLAQGIIENVFMIADGWRQLLNLFGAGIEPMETFEAVVTASRERTSELSAEFDKLIQKEMPSEQIENFTASVESAFDTLQEKAAETQQAVANVVGGGGDGEVDPAVERMRASAEERFVILSESLLTEREAENIAFENKLMDLENFYLTSGMLDSAYDATKEKLRAQHEKNLSKIEKKGLTDRQKFEMKTTADKVAFVASSSMQLLSQSANSNKALFNLNKAASLATATASLPSAVIKSYENAGGYPWGIVPAGLMAAAGAAQIGTIAGSSFGGAREFGGPVGANRSYLVGEAGPEIFTPRGNGEITPNDEISGASIGTVNIVINTSAGSFADILEDELEEFVAGPLIRTLDKLDDNGVRQAALERSNI